MMFLVKNNFLAVVKMNGIKRVGTTAYRSVIAYSDQFKSAGAKSVTVLDVCSERSR